MLSSVPALLTFLILFTASAKSFSSDAIVLAKTKDQLNGNKPPLSDQGTQGLKNAQQLEKSYKSQPPSLTKDRYKRDSALLDDTGDPLMVASSLAPAADLPDTPDLLRNPEILQLIYNLAKDGKENIFDDYLDKAYRAAAADADLGVDQDEDTPDGASPEREEKRTRLFVGKRPRLFLGKRTRLFVGKRPRLFLGKRQRLFVGKRQRLFVGKRQRDFVGKRDQDLFGERDEIITDTMKCFKELESKSGGFQSDVLTNQRYQECVDKSRDNLEALKRIRDFVGKRDSFWGDERESLPGDFSEEEGLVGKRFRDFVGKRNEPVEDAEKPLAKFDDDFMNDKRSNEFFGIRSHAVFPRRLWVGKREVPLETMRIPTKIFDSEGRANKKLKEFMDKKSREFVGKRSREFVGKRSREFVGKRSREFVGKRSREFVGKRSREFVGKRPREFLGKRSREFVGKRSREFVGKRSLASSTGL
ncbi:protein prqfv-amide [Plakobranchus ocellatus]|uniref:Protein prqfv-amide n=1 Tax=Plakobranchus ocellatus TaxID=259542 RepID=A0AAV4B952_9GAST|nr:protein prqfv-amide [Plakobranchus ocellatus]